MPVLRGEDEEEREDVGGQAAVALPLLRGVVDAPPRWRRRRCLREFLGWLMSKGSQRDMTGQGRTFRRRTAGFWELWPMPVADGERHRVPYVDGIWLERDLVVLICRSDERVVSWYMARSETSRAWSAPMDPIPAPDVVAADGGTGFAGAVRRSWPGTRVQRCVFHAFCQVRRYTTSRPRLQAGVELYGLAGDLLHLEAPRQAELWVGRYLRWCGFWADFLEDTTVIDGRRVFTHEKPRRARCRARTTRRRAWTPACARCSGTAAGCRSCAG